MDCSARGRSDAITLARLFLIVFELITTKVTELAPTEYLERRFIIIAQNSSDSKRKGFGVLCRDVEPARRVGVAFHFLLNKFPLVCDNLCKVVTTIEVLGVIS